MVTKGLRPLDFARLFNVPRERPVAMLLRPHRTSDWTLARLLCETRERSNVTIVTTLSGAESLSRLQQTHGGVNVQPLIETIHGDDFSHTSQQPQQHEDERQERLNMRTLARYAINHNISDIALGDTRACMALSRVAKFDGSFVGMLPKDCTIPGLEVLPNGVLTVHQPLSTINENLIDSSCSSMQSDLDFLNLESEVERASRLIPHQETTVDKLVECIERREHAVDFLTHESDQLIRKAVLEASHWGYLVVRRSALRTMWRYNGRAGRAVAVHAMCRLVAHVSGAAVLPAADDELIGRLTGALLRDADELDNEEYDDEKQMEEEEEDDDVDDYDDDDKVEVDIGNDDNGSRKGKRKGNRRRRRRRNGPSEMLAPLPKGRTVGGIVVRPATGRFAKRVLQAERRQLQQQQRYNSYDSKHQTRHSLQNADETEHPDDLMILTREPDHETGSLLARRMRGTRACAPLSVTGGAIYWDHRFVLCATSADELHEQYDVNFTVPFQPKTIFNAVLSDDVVSDEQLIDTSLYVRQVRKTDWERITAITGRVRDFQVPYECIRALPAVFRKTKGTASLGTLAASPHLAVSSAQNLVFSAVRMPRFRTLPPEIDPGFRVEHLSQMESSARGRDKRNVYGRRKNGGGGRGPQIEQDDGVYHRNNRSSSWRERIRTEAT